jgi:quercetin dioxygenase-like cupin family protein
VEVLRFGPGFRRSQEQSGARGLDEQTIWSDPRARVTELAFAPRAVLPPRTSPQHGLFVVVSGGGWVQVGAERAAVRHGEAVEWPPLVVHGAWTDGSHMRAILIEVPDAPDEVVIGPGARPAAGASRPPISGTDPLPPHRTAGPAPADTAAQGRLVDQPSRPEDHDPTEGEPW